MSKEYKRSPIFYMGNKYRLLKQMLPHFPSDIKTFYDVFGGSGVVTLNVVAEDYMYNEFNKTIRDLFEHMVYSSPEDTIFKIEDNIKEFNLMQGRGGKRNKTDDFEEYQEKAKENFYKFRNHYNETRDINDLYTLSFYCNSNNIRFNKNGEFNMPIGNQRFIPEKHGELIKNAYSIFNGSVSSMDYVAFMEYYSDDFKEGDFIYLDPPYTNTNAIYNEQMGWSFRDDLALFDYLEELDSRGIKWGLSNVFENKGFKNEHLIKWCEENNWNVKHLNINYCSGGKGNANTDEVFITNYE